MLEGIDGSGTTTQAEHLATFFRGKRQPVLLTNEPSNGPAGMLIRLALAKRLVGPNHEFHDGTGPASDGVGPVLDPNTLALLFAADRADHIATQIGPSLASGRHVICDRYVLSSLAYQGLTVEAEWILEINRFARRPDLTLYFDVPAELALKRMRRSRWAKDLYEDVDQLAQIRDRYLQLIQESELPLGPIVVLDATLREEEVWRCVNRHVEELLAEGRVEDSIGELSLF